MSEFKPGDMVECIKADDFNPEIDTEFVPLVLGAHYTIEAVGVVDFIDGTFPAVWLREIKNACSGAYGASRFRLIKPRATDISIFREIVKEAMETGKVTPSPIRRLRIRPDLQPGSRATRMLS